jgi:hypothetical protein
MRDPLGVELLHLPGGFLALLVVAQQLIRQQDAILPRLTNLQKRVGCGVDIHQRIVETITRCLLSIALRSFPGAAKSPVSGKAHSVARACL